MPISKVSEGDQVCVVGTEHDLPNASGDTSGGVYYALFDLSPMQAGDSVEIRAYVKVRDSGTGNTLRQVRYRAYSGVQDGTIDGKSPDKDFDGLAIVTNIAAKLTIKQTGGVARTFPWKLFRVS